MGYQICIDIGGTFTDCLASEGNTDIRIFKAPTTPPEFHKGFMDVLMVAAKAYNRKFNDFVADIDVIVHGSTVSTNALVQKKVSKTGLILNEGHPDVLVLREGPRKGAFEWRLDYPEPYIPKSFTRTIGGRIDARGFELQPLDEDAVMAAAQDFKKMGVEAVAVGLLWSVVNASHELRVKEILNAELPNVPVTLSHDVNPIAREYKRVISAAIDASINLIIRNYVQDLEASLKLAGFRGELLLANCVGGMMPVSEMLKRPIYSVMSGPTLAPIAALSLTDEPDVVVGDMGGTTFDVSALRDSQIIVTPDAVIHDDVLGIPKVDVRSVGAGGGSIASIDVGGMLLVGPESAGANPGPACYGLGNTQPTVTDANVVLGIIDPDFFLEGKMNLDAELSRKAVQTIADKLNVSLDEAAYAIYTTSNHNMVAAIEDITIQEGINPRDSYFVCGGGGTSAHIGEMVEVLGISRYMVPRFVAGLSAYGGLISDIRWEKSAVLQTDSREFSQLKVAEVLNELVKEGEQFLETSQILPEYRKFEFFFMGRYEYQSWEIEVPFSAHKDSLMLAVDDLVVAFHKMHERIYSIKSENDTVEFTSWKVRAIGKRETERLKEAAKIELQRGNPQPKTKRSVYDIKQHSRSDIPVYSFEDLGSGAVITGPCLLEAPTFTAYLLIGHVGTIDEYGNCLVEVNYTS